MALFATGATQEASGQSWVAGLPPAMRAIVERVLVLSTARSNAKSDSRAWGASKRLEFSKLGGEVAYNDALGSLKADSSLYNDWLAHSYKIGGLGQGGNELAIFGLGMAGAAGAFAGAAGGAASGGAAVSGESAVMSSAYSAPAIATSSGVSVVAGGSSVAGGSLLSSLVPVALKKATSPQPTAVPFVSESQPQVAPANSPALVLGSAAALGLVALYFLKGKLI